MLYECNSLTSLDLSSFNTSHINSPNEGMYQRICNCSSLNSLNLFNFNKLKEIMMKDMFYQCKNLSFINIGNATMENSAII